MSAIRAEESQYLDGHRSVFDCPDPAAVCKTGRGVARNRSTSSGASGGSPARCAQFRHRLIVRQFRRGERDFGYGWQAVA